MTTATVSAGMAKPNPTEPPLGEKIAEVTPTTVPSSESKGPPELPRLIAASVCRKSMYGSSSSVRARAETMPALTDCPQPKNRQLAGGHLEQGNIGKRIGPDDRRG